MAMLNYQRASLLCISYKLGYLVKHHPCSLIHSSYPQKCIKGMFEGSPDFHTRKTLISCTCSLKYPYNKVLSQLRPHYISIQPIICYI